MPKPSILIVEDERIIALDIRRQLESLGYLVIGQTDDAEDAVLKAGELRPDLVLMDIVLSGEMDGIQAAEQIQHRFHVPVIFLTAFSDETTLERARLAGPFGFIVKPFDAGDLSGNIEIALYKSQMEKRLRESENKFRSVIHYASDGIALTDDHGNIIEWNPALEKITGLTAGDAIGRLASDVVIRLTPREENTPDYREQTTASWKSAVESHYSNVNQVSESTIQTVDGSRRTVERTEFALETAQGMFGGLIMRDITERKQAEKEIEDLLTDLKNKNEELEQFTYTVSHDLKAPLITISGFLGYLEEDARSGNLDRIGRDIHRIKEAISKMENLLGGLLDLSRVGRIVNPFQAVPLKTAVQDALELMAGRILAGGVQVHIVGDLPVVYGDPLRLAQVLQNLVDNAVKFSGSHLAPTIEVGQRGSDSDGKPILYVKDNGMGIAPELQESVFGLFNKLDPLSQGTGIGLALVKRIVENHDGRIWVESEGLGKGATFCFTLPPVAVD